MIPDIIFAVIGVLFNILAALLGSLNLILPPEIFTAIGNFIGYAGYLQGFLPIYKVPSYSGLVATVGILDITRFMFVFLIFWYSAKLVLWCFHFVPFIKSKTHFPQH